MSGRHQSINTGLIRRGSGSAGFVGILCCAQTPRCLVGLFKPHQKVIARRRSPRTLGGAQPDRKGVMADCFVQPAEVPARAEAEGGHTHLVKSN